MNTIHNIPGLNSIYVLTHDVTPNDHFTMYIDSMNVEYSGLSTNEICQIITYKLRSSNFYGDLSLNCQNRFFVVDHIHRNEEEELFINE